jgi:uncharacterized protein
MSSPSKKPSWWPDRHLLEQHPRLQHLKHHFDHQRIWRISHRTLHKAAAVGVVCAMIPGPLQMIAATLWACWWKVHLPTAVLLTFVSNPITIPIIYWMAYDLGAWLTQQPLLSLETLQNLWQVLDWWQFLLRLGWNWALGMVLLTVAAAVLVMYPGYLASCVWVRHRWRHRHRHTSRI